MARGNGRAGAIEPARRAGARPRREYWRALIEECCRSGRSQAEFCRRRGISPGTLGYWKCILAREARPGRSPMPSRPMPPAFLPVRLAAPPASSAAEHGAPLDECGEPQIVLEHGRLIRVRGRVGAQWLRAG